MNTRLERQTNEQLRRLPAGHRDKLAVAADLERPEQRDLQHLQSVRPDPRPSVLRRRAVRSAWSSPPPEQPSPRSSSAHHQPIVSGRADGSPMPDEIDNLLRRMIGGDAAAAEEVLRPRPDRQHTEAAGRCRTDHHRTARTAGPGSEERRHDPGPPTRRRRHRSPERQCRCAGCPCPRTSLRFPGQHPRGLDRRPDTTIPPATHPPPPVGVAMSNRSRSPRHQRPPAARRCEPPRRWMVSFLGFPLGGFAAMLVVGAVDSLTAALIGGLITGTILGAAQSWAMGRSGPPALQWIAATAVGMMAGFGVGSAVVDYHTSLACADRAGRHQRACRRHRPSPGAPAAGSAGWPWSGRPRLAGSLGARLGRHHLRRHRRRPAVHRLRLQWRTGRHRPDRCPPAQSSPGQQRAHHDPARRLRHRPGRPPRSSNNSSPSATTSLP